ncbi:MAG: hypothetical protein KF842_12195 [Caulobacter sp.]|nr:hypothetical protein [Caulobacter sp.]
MSRFPKIQSPCPYKANLSALMDGDTCRMCQRQVHDLSAMDDQQRQAFLQSCREEVCVSYRFPLGPVLAAAGAAVALAATPLAAAAQDAPAAQDPEMEMYEIIVGGITDLANIEYVEDAADQTLADLPVVYEDDEPMEQAASAGPSTSGPSGG